jgi:hypothetical protein
MAADMTLDRSQLSWFLEEGLPGVRYMALRDLLDLPQNDPELVQSRREAHTRGPIAVVLEHMHPDGYWEKPGAGYGPKYTSTVWSLVLLAQLGAEAGEDERIGRACSYLLEHAMAADGQLSINGTPSGTIDCLQGNLLWALLELGFTDPRMEKAFEWMARSVTGEGLAAKEDKDARLRYYAYNCGPGFACGANYGQACAWGGTKVMRAFGNLPAGWQTPLTRQAVEQGVEFLLSTDPMKADWPSPGADKPSGNWWKLGFPVFYVTDLLQVAEALVALGCGDDPRLANTLEFIRSKQDEQGRWMLEYDYSGKTWVDFGRKKQPNQWVTLRALKVLRKISKI